MMVPSVPRKFDRAAATEIVETSIDHYTRVSRYDVGTETRGRAIEAALYAAEHNPHDPRGAVINAIDREIRAGIVAPG